MNIEIRQRVKQYEDSYGAYERLNHFARNENGDEIQTTPISAFFYTFALYNTLYSIDWNNADYPVTNGNDRLQQQRFEDYLKGLVNIHPSILLEELQLLKQYDFNQDWIGVTPDPHISIDEGQRFFNNLEKLKSTLDTITLTNKTEIDQVFRLIRKCRIFVYKARCSIFHGSTPLPELNDDAQKRRIEVYHDLIKIHLNAFFRLFSEKNNASQ